jgi:hypothetical protein
MGKKASKEPDDVEFKVGDRVKVNMHRGRIVEAGRFLFSANWAQGNPHSRNKQLPQTVLLTQ